MHVKNLKKTKQILNNILEYIKFETIYKLCVHTMYICILQL